jgi:ankyrin repeat protein
MSVPAVQDPINCEEDFQSFEECFQKGGRLSLKDLPAWIEARPHVAHAEDGRGRNLLHRALVRRSIPGVVRWICERFPHMALHRASSSGWGHRLPLHDAVVRHWIGLEDVRALVEAYPQALRERDNNGDVPLHCALLVWEVESHEVIRYLVSRDPASVRIGRSAANSHNQKPMWMALEDPRGLMSRNLDLIRLLHEAWPESLQMIDGMGRTPLHAAVDALAPPDVLAYVVDRGGPASLRVTDREGRVPLHLLATARGSGGPEDDRGGREWVAAAHVLLEAWPGALHERPHNGELPVHAAALLPATDLLRLFVAHFPESIREKAGNDGATPLHRAVTSPWRGAAATQFLVQTCPGSARETDAEGRTPLHVAVRWIPGPDHPNDDSRQPIVDRMRRVDLLLEAGPDAARVRAMDGSLPLHCAAATPNRHVVRRLVRAYPESVFAVTNDGRTPLHCAVDGAYDRHIPAGCGTWLPERRTVLSLLLGRWPDSIRLRCNSGLLPVHYAALRMVSSPSLRFLVEQWPESAGLPTPDGSLPIHLAVAGSVAKPEMVRFLVEQMPESLLVPDSNGSLPLHVALATNELSREIVRVLVRHGAEALGVANAGGSLPAHVAASHATCPMDVLSLVVGLHPEALQAKDGNGWLPFQLAASNDAALDVVYFLISKWPEGVSRGGGDGASA